MRACIDPISLMLCLSMHRFAYARFNGMYVDRYAMRGDAKLHDDTRPTVFATQSTHKLLAGIVMYRLKIQYVYKR